MHACLAAHLVKDIFTGSPQHDAARLRVGTVHNECEELIPYLDYLEQTRSRADVTLTELVSTASV